MAQQATALRRLPSVDEVLKAQASRAAVDRFGRPATVAAVRRALGATRAALKIGQLNGMGVDALAAAGLSQLDGAAQPDVRPGFQFSGPVLHTTPGRAVLAEAAVEAAVTAMRQAIALEFDLESGRRGERGGLIRGLLCELTGGEDATVVNNNAAAVLIMLNTLAKGREAIVSRGELIEIGGAFRMPDIMARAGVKLVEIGTTNRTHLKDYAGAISSRTAALMKVHTSNYEIQGFTASVTEDRLAELAHRHKLPLITDLGSGMLVDLEEYGLPHEPTPREALAAGADVVTFSGDKLLGGPQAGLVIGRKDLIERMRRNPIKRALRVDKMTLAALDAVLALYSNAERLRQVLPTLRLLARPLAEISEQAGRLLPAGAAPIAGQAQATLVECRSQIGSGSLPVDLLPSSGIAVVAPGKRRHALAASISGAFRALPIPVIGRIKDGAFIMDLRCLEHENEFAAQLKHLDLDCIKREP